MLNVAQDVAINQRKKQKSFSKIISRQVIVWKENIMRERDIKDIIRVFAVLNHTLGVMVNVLTAVRARGNMIGETPLRKMENGIMSAKMVRIIAII